MDKQERPEPAVGQVWRWKQAGRELVVQAKTGMQLWRLNGMSFGQLAFENGTLEYVRSPEAAEPDVDWNAYLPPHPLPDTGPKEFKAGQVWASCCDAGEASVRRIIGVNRSWMRYAVLVGHDYGGSEMMAAAPTALHSVLIQDVGEPHPRPVEEVYGTPLERAVDLALVKVTCRRCAVKNAVEFDGERPLCWDCYEHAKKLRLTIKENPLRPCCGLAASDCECPKAGVYWSSESNDWYTKKPPKNPSWHVEVRQSIVPPPKPYHLDHHCETCAVKGVDKRETVKQRWCQTMDGDGNKLGAELEWTCDDCHLLDEAEFAEETAEAQAKKYEPEPRYDARQLLASVGLGPGELCCPVRGVRGPR